jgi:hypothetical protein
VFGAVSEAEHMKNAKMSSIIAFFFNSLQLFAVPQPFDPATTVGGQFYVELNGPGGDPFALYP